MRSVEEGMRRRGEEPLCEVWRRGGGGEEKNHDAKCGGGEEAERRGEESYC
jgi:hypothetical protein